jgi:antirestriction protein ArdC
MILGCQKFTSKYWLTFNQINQLGGKLKKGSKGVAICKYGTFEKSEEKSIEIESESETKFYLKYYYVFNLDQTEGIEKPESDIDLTKISFDPIHSAESIVNNFKNKPEIVFETQQAYYSPSADIINMPKKDTFTSEQNYYATLFHELGHSTGHSTRLNRTTLVKNASYKSKDYSQEELVAEFTSTYLCAEAKLERTFNNSVAYIQGWSKAIKQNSRLLLSASSQAQRASNYILNRNNS